MSEKQQEQGDTQAREAVADKVAAHLDVPGQTDPEAPEATKASEQEAPQDIVVQFGGVERKLSIEEVQNLLAEREQIAKEKAAVDAAREELKSLIPTQPAKADEPEDEYFEDLEPRQPRKQKPQPTGDPRLDALLPQLQPMLEKAQQAEKTSYVERALSKYPVFEENAVAKDLAVKGVYDAMTANPHADVDKVAADYAAKTHKLLTKVQPSPTSPDPRGRSDVFQVPEVEPTYQNLEAGNIRDRALARYQDAMRRTRR
jgi:hypothetical protein